MGQGPLQQLRYQYTLEKAKIEIVRDIQDMVKMISLINELTLPNSDEVRRTFKLLYRSYTVILVEEVDASLVSAQD